MSLNERYFLYISAQSIKYVMDLWHGMDLAFWKRQWWSEFLEHTDSARDLLVLLATRSVSALSSLDFFLERRENAQSLVTTHWAEGRVQILLLESEGQFSAPWSWSSETSKLKWVTWRNVGNWRHIQPTCILM